MAIEPQERAFRLRRAGKRCALCDKHIGRPWREFERLCNQCLAREGKVAVYLLLRIGGGGWQVSFWQEEGLRFLGRYFQYRTEEPARAMVRRHAAHRSELAAFDDDWRTEGKAIAMLVLTEEEVKRLG